jgi:hypothetical protein
MADDTVKRFVRHLEFLGYAPSGPGDGGWWHAAHPRRCNLYFLGTPMGLRLHGVFYLGKGITMKHRAWLAFVNRFNEESVVARATLSIDDEADAFLRTRTLLPPTYERRLYGALLDAWHSDLEFMAQAPTQEGASPLAQESETVN